MTFKRIVKASLVLCLTAILVIAVSGCEDLGAYEDTQEYYQSFGDIVLINGTTREEESYSVEDYFYNEESRKDFLAGEDGAYEGIEYGEYVYVAIPFESNINMDTVALFLQSQNDVSVYINVFVSDRIPNAWRAIADNVLPDVGEDGGASAVPTDDTLVSDPDPETRIGDFVVHLEQGKWNSFVLDNFIVNGETQSSIQINEGQYLLFQIRNNSGVRVFDEEKGCFVDPQTGIELPTAEITMTNLLIRALEIGSETQEQGGE